MFSVVIPLYNKENSISDTIQSVLRQTFKKFELIIVDDGSTDSSINKIEKFHDDRIKIYKQQNNGVSSARNTGISKSNFNWIAFLDADDLWKSDHLETIFYLIEENPNEKIFSSSWSNNIEDYNKENDVHKGYRLIQNYFKVVNDIDVICSSTAVINLQCFNHKGFFNTSISRGEDLECWARLAKSYNFIKSDKVTAIYRLGAENRSVDFAYPITSSFAYHLNLNSTGQLDSEEKRYYQHILRRKIIASLKTLQFRNAFLLVNKYRFNLIRFR